MKEVKSEFNHTLEIKKSKFIAHILPYSEFKNILAKLKQQHPKARHFVYAYRYLNEFNQIVQNSSDDGEPKGTSARPSLSVITGADIINTAVIIVRYFGGTRLGTGGLVRAYSQAVNEVCDISEFKTYEDLQTIDILITYSNLAKTKYKLEQLNINIINQNFDKNVTLTLQATQDKLDCFNK